MAHGAWSWPKASVRARSIPWAVTKSLRALKPPYRVARRRVQASAIFRVAMAGVVCDALTCGEAPFVVWSGCLPAPFYHVGGLSHVRIHTLTFANHRCSTPDPCEIEVELR